MDFFMTSADYGRIMAYIGLFLLVYCFLLWRPKNYWGKIMTLFVVSEFFVCWMLYLFEPTTLFSGLVEYLETYYYNPKSFGALPYPLKLFWIYFTFGVFVKIFCYIRYLSANQNLYLALIWSPLHRDIEPPFQGIFTGEYNIKKLSKKRSVFLLFLYLFILYIVAFLMIIFGLPNPDATSDFPDAINYISIETWFSVTLLIGSISFFIPALTVLIFKDWGIYLFQIIQKLIFTIIKKDIPKE